MQTKYPTTIDSKGFLTLTGLFFIMKISDSSSQPQPLFYFNGANTHLVQFCFNVINHKLLYLSN